MGDLRNVTEPGEQIPGDLTRNHLRTSGPGPEPFPPTVPPDRLRMLRSCDKARGMVTPERTRRESRARMRLAFAALFVALLAGLDRTAAAQTPDAAAADLAEAAAVREAADERVAELTADLERLDAEGAALVEQSDQLVAEMERARSDLRAAVVAAFVSDGIHDPLISSLLEPDSATASARRTYLQHRAGDRRDAAERFESLKKGNDPRLAEFVDRREALSARLASATEAAQQARANEADAERFFAEAQQRAAAERVVAERAAAERAASERAATERATAERVASERSTGRRTAADDSATEGSAAAPGPSQPTVTATAAQRPVPAPIVPRDAYSAPLPNLPEGGPSEEQWAALRQCESGGNYRIVSASGRYRGAYQFDFQTWESLGGAGDPAEALPVEQDARARLLYFRRGTKPWPHCGRHLV